MDENEIKHFFCRDCRQYWKTAHWVDQEGGFFCECPECGKLTESVPHYYGNLTKMWASATGPKTQDGKKRSKLNAYKHGGYSNHYHLLAPALAGKFPECNGCDYFNDCKEKYKYCPVILGPMIRVVNAYEEGRLEDLKVLTGISQAKVFQILQMSLSEVFKKGTLVPKVIRTKALQKFDDEIEDFVDDGEGKVLEWQANPLLKRIVELMHTLGMDAEQQNMTPERQKEQENTEGYLKAESAKSENEMEFRKRQEKAMDELRAKLTAATQMRNDDDTLKEHEKRINKNNTEERDDVN